MSIQRISVAGVNVDICRAEDIESEVLELLAKPGTKQIVFLSVWEKANTPNACAMPI